MPHEAPELRDLLDRIGQPHAELVDGQLPPMAGAEGPESEETPDPSASEETPETPDTESEGTEPEDSETPEDVNYEKRYNDIRPQYDRQAQFLAALEGRHGAEAQAQALMALGGPKALAEALGELGYEIEGEDEPDEDFEDDEFRDPRVDDLLQKEQEREEAEFLNRLEKHIDSSIEDLAKEAKIDLTDTEKNLIFYAVEPGEDGQPDVKAAFEQVTGLRDEHIKQYRNSKKNAPSAPAKGSSGEPAVDLSDPKKRRAHALEVANAAFESASSQ